MKVTRRSVAALAIAAGTGAGLARAQSITTLFASNNGGSAGGMVYFDLTVGPSPITITGFDINTSTTAGSTIGFQLYTHTGTYVGTTTNSALWTLQSTGTALAAGTNLPSPVTLNSVVVLAPNTTYAMGISLAAQAPAVAGAHRYTNGTGSNQAYSNADLALALGGASNTPWGSFIASRVWNGTIYYSLGGTLGACCRPDGTCISTTSANCTAQGGTYQGDGVDCASVQCPQPPNGACCFASGSCTEVSTYVCTAQGGVWQGANTTCATANCPQPGACCFVDGTCTDGLQPAACTTQGGVFHGPSTVCATETCPITPPTATPLSLTACGLTTATGTLAAGQVVWYSFTLSSPLASPAYLDIDTEGSALAPSNDTEIGLYTATGALITTDDDDGSNLLSQLSYGNTSPRPAYGNSVLYNGRDSTGAWVTLPAGTYYLAVGGFNSTFGTTRWNVASASTNVGAYQVRLATCGDVPTGACCRTDGTCAALTQYACVTTNGGIYQGDGAVCGATACPEYGACCKADGSCVAAFSTACANTYGVFRGQGSTCATANCPTPNVAYSNCTLATGPTSLSGVAAPTGFVWSECARDETDPFTANTVAGFTGSGGLRLADDFTVPAGGLNVGYVRAYAYLSGATTPGVTAATLQIWNGPPNAGGAVIFGDTTTNRLAANSFTSIYRIFSTVASATAGNCTGPGTAPGTTRRLQYVYIAVNQFLPAGTYWIDLDYTGASFSPPTTQSDAIGRQCDPNNHNALQYNAGVWGPLTDAGQGCVPAPVDQDLAFDIIGAPPPCYPNCDGSTTPPALNVLDFACFLNRFAAGDTWANCDNSTVAPVLNVLDFACFLNSFAAGCS